MKFLNIRTHTRLGKDSKEFMLSNLVILDVTNDEEYSILESIRGINWSDQQTYIQLFFIYFSRNVNFLL